MSAAYLPVAPVNLDALTYSHACELLSGARNGQRTLAPNTYLYRRSATTLAVRLYHTDIVVIHDDGTYTLNSGGWRTVTTKERINRFAPVVVYQRSHEWYVIGMPFRDGMRV
jgi:hypothetical protein